MILDKMGIISRKHYLFESGKLCVLFLSSADNMKINSSINWSLWGMLVVKVCL